MQTEIPSDLLITTGFAQTNHWPVQWDENIDAAYKKSHIYSLHRGPCLSRCPRVVIFSTPHPPQTLHYTSRLLLHWGQNTDPLHSLFWKMQRATRQRVFSEAHPRGPIKAKVKSHSPLSYVPRHYTLRGFSLPWRGCCTLTPQGHSGHSIGRYSNPGSVTESQGETLYCFLLWNPCRAAGEIQS